MPSLVPPIEEDKSLLEATKHATRNTYAGAFGQIPGLSVPCGFSQSGLPIGLQLIGKAFDEGHLLSVAHDYDREHQFGRQAPTLED